MNKITVYRCEYCDEEFASEKECKEHEGTHIIDYDQKNDQDNGGDEVYYYRKIRCHNRQIHKSTIRKDGIRKHNQAEYEVKGFRLFDHVQYKGNTHCFVFGRRKTGVFSVRDINGVKVTKWGDISCNKLKLLSPQSGYITDRYIVKHTTESEVQVAPLRY